MILRVCVEAGNNTEFPRPSGVFAESLNQIVVRTGRARCRARVLHSQNGDLVRSIQGMDVSLRIAIYPKSIRSPVQDSDQEVSTIVRSIQLLRLFFFKELNVLLNPDIVSICKLLKFRDCRLVFLNCFFNISING